MFGRLLWKLLRSNRARLAVALVAITSGATVISALLDLEFDIEGQLTREFRALGANVVISRGHSGLELDADQPRSEVRGSPSLMERAPVLAAIERTRTPDVVAAAPLLYIVARAQGTPVVIAGTWLDQMPNLDPTWRLEGSWVHSRDDATACLIGRTVARQLKLVPSSHLDLTYLDRHAEVRVAGVIDAGGAEDNQVFVSLPVVEELARVDDQIELVEMSIRGTGATIARQMAQLAVALPGYEVRPIRAVTEAEGRLLDRTRLLIALMVALILVLTALCVLATMAALAMERRKDVGLMKALGGSISRIVGLFLAEVGTLGAVGGLVGCVMGMVLARWMGQRVFGASIKPLWEIFPLTIALMIGVALVGALPLRFLGKVNPAVILRGE
jgi:putative ABC transport system permease protein